MSNSLNGKVALITGASMGIGLASAHELAARGVRLFITGRRGPEIADAARAIGRGAVGVQADVSNLTDLDRLYEQISRDAGRLDVVFANAGGGDMLPLEAITAEHVDRIFGTNVKGLLFTVQKALPLMKEGGSVILTGSTAGRKGTASFSVYSATKAAVSATRRRSPDGPSWRRRGGGEGRRFPRVWGASFINGAELFVDGEVAQI